MNRHAEARLEEEHIQKQLNIQRGLHVSPDEWVGDLQRKGFPDRGWSVFARIEYDGTKHDCFRCDYPDLKNALLVKHPDVERQVVVGPYCATLVTRRPLAI